MMLKKLIYSGTVLGILGTAVLGLGHNFKAWALPTEQILQKLNPVPVFTVTNDKGVPLLISGQDEAQVAGIFINPQDAESFIAELKTKQPELASQVQVTLVSLGEVYKLAQANQEQEKDVNFAYVPEKTEVDLAKTVLSENGQEYKGGVPLFVAKGGAEDGYLTIEKNSEQVIPFFFEKQQLENMVAKFKEQQPDLAATVQIEVIPLEGVIAALQTSDAEMLNKIVLVPSTESVEFVKEKTSEQGEPNQPQQ